MVTERDVSERLLNLSPEKRALLEKRLRGSTQGKQKAPHKQSILPRQGQEPVRLSFGQERLWFLDQLVPGNPIYTEQSILRLQFPLIPSVLKQSINEIVRRHEILRSRIIWMNGYPYQVVDPTLDLSLEVVDLRRAPAAEVEQVEQRLRMEEAQHVFDLRRGPLLRTLLLQFSQTDFLFILTMHHIVADGWSMPIFFSELTALYRAFANGQPSPLPELPI
ncbi:MAG: condensation domain-containing protein, partial [Planctomycetota bacterium]